MLFGCVPWPVELAEAYRRAGYWQGRSLGTLLHEAAGRNPSRTAVVAGANRMTYRELSTAADELASGLLGIGVRPLDRVVVQLPNIVEFVSLLFALFRIGAIPVLALPGHRKSEIAHLCAHSDAVAYIVKDRFQGYDYRRLAREIRADVPGLRHVLVVGDPEEFSALAGVRADPGPFPHVDSSEPALFLLSGGTTGLPKMIPRTHDDYAYNLRACAEALRVDGDSTYLAANPVAHNAALGCPGVLGTLLAGGKAVLAASPSPDEAFPLIRREGVTLTTLVPPLVRLWVEAATAEPIDFSGLLLQVGSAKFSPALAVRTRKVLGCQLTQWFGLSEGMLTYTRLDDPDEVVLYTEGRPLAAADEILVGHPSSGVTIAQGEQGELLARGPYTIRGYYKAPEQNARSFTADGYFRTGDLVTLTAGGNLVISGRIKDIINRGGDKVSAEEVADHLGAHPHVSDVAVVGIPDTVLGERICAFVISANGDLRLPALKAFLRERGLATYKLPDQLVQVDGFPHTPVGKVDKAALRAAAPDLAGKSG